MLHQRCAHAAHTQAPDKGSPDERGRELLSNHTTRILLCALHVCLLHSLSVHSESVFDVSADRVVDSTTAGAYSALLGVYAEVYWVKY